MARLAKKYAHDPLYNVKRSGNLVRVTTEPKIANFYDKTKGNAKFSPKTPEATTLYASSNVGKQWYEKECPFGSIAEISGKNLILRDMDVEMERLIF